MPMTFVKRSVSPLHFEPLEPPPEEVLCPGSDNETNEDEREKKRVRRENLGKQYLEGKTLLIQTAALRGPFERNWINPWDNKRRKFGVGLRSVAEASATYKTSPYREAEPGRNSTKAKRKSIRDAELDLVSHISERAASPEESIPKRIRRHGEELAGSNKPGHLRRSPSEAAEQGRWLKSDKAFVTSRFRDARGSPTPTPASKPRSKVSAVPIKPRTHSTEALHSKPSHVIVSKNHIPSEPKILSFPNQISTQGRDGGNGADRRAKHPVEGNPNINVPSDSKTTRVKVHDLAFADTSTRHGYVEAKRLSQQAVQLAGEERQGPQKLLIDQDVVTDPLLPQPSRLAPYVSEFIISSDAATSAGLKAASKSPRPSPRTVPSSSALPEFQYRHATKGIRSRSPKARYLPAQRSQYLQSRARSISTSSSGSSEFAEELEAAQAKAASKSMGSSHPTCSHPSSPIYEKPETASVKRNTHALRRLTFTSSGQPKIKRSNSSHLTNSSSSQASIAAGVSTAGANEKELESKAFNLVQPSRKHSTRSSVKSQINGNNSRNSMVLPEAQVVSDVPAQLTRLPSGRSTDLLETDRQSPKVISLEDEDSYINLSTQAAMLKAQKSFQNDVLSPVSTRPDLPKIKAEPKPSGQEYNISNITPSANQGYQKHMSTRHAVKAESQDEGDAMSTQAMADAITPFAITTVKKRPPAFEKRTSFAPSPTRHRSSIPASIPSPALSPVDAFHQPLSMSTSLSGKSPEHQTLSQISKPQPTPPSPPSHPNTTSKPASSLINFSALPAGTATETDIFQDGQQQPQPYFDTSLPHDPFVTPFATARSKGNGTSNGQSSGISKRADSSWDLNAAIEEAGSFLGDWDVEAEARKEGNSSRKRDAEVRKGVLSVGKAKA